ncbi:transaldolase [Candidatus Daviesbacteria bacterium]|nr:transaldolase [Candidatus Daviesbacteria bacterium]
MPKPANLKTKIFLDSGNVSETKETIELLGFLDGQTTNPTLIAKNPEAQQRLAAGKKFSQEEIYSFYKSVVSELSLLIPEGSISIEVYADENTSTEEMFTQSKEMFSWIPNAHIKYPTIKAGLEAAQTVYAATLGAKKGDVFVSPFIGRLDDKGENGMDLIKNITKMYKESDGHVELLAASVRNMNHFLYSLALGVDIITAPFSVLKEWAQKGMPVPGPDFNYPAEELKSIPYQDLDLNKHWTEFDITHPLTEAGINRFSADWNALIATQS